MHRSKPRKALFAGALALTALSSAHARPLVVGNEPREHVTFSDAIADGSPVFNLSSTSTVDSGKKVFGELPPATFGWEPDSKIKLNHGAHGHELDGTFDVTKFHDEHGHGVAPVAAIPEPSTYVLLAVGLAGVALIGRRRSRGG